MLSTLGLSVNPLTTVTITFWNSAAVTGSHPTYPQEEAVPGKPAFNSFKWVSPPSSPFSSPPFPIHFSLLICAQPIFGSAVPKSKGFQGKGDKVGSEAGWVGNGSFRTGAKNDFLHSIPCFPPKCQTLFLCYYFYIPYPLELPHSSPRFWVSRSKKPFKQKCQRDYEPGQVERN